MRMLLTGATEVDTAQTKPSQSLGGFRSSTPVILENPNNLFDDVTLLGKTNGWPETRGFMLQNDGDDLVEDVKINYTYPEGAPYKLEIAVVTALNNNQMEAIATSRDTPYYAIFKEATVGNEITVGDMAAGKCVGVWLRMTPKNKIYSCDEVKEATT